jgi:RTX calcium-binding nonapeptide repeat (4 copies)
MTRVVLAAITQTDVAPRRRGRRLILALLACAPLTAAPTAGASTASVDTSTQTLSYIADPGEANFLRLMRTPAGYQLQDLGVVFPKGASPECSGAGPYRVDCLSPVRFLWVELGDKGDSVNVASSDPATIYGGGGDDRIGGDHGGDRLYGEAGDDILDGERTPGQASDTLSGGPGTDMVDYGSRTRPVHVVLDGVGNDGEAGEHDTVEADVEDVFGGQAGDSIVGDAGPNTLLGGPGDDRLEGAGGRDTLDAGAGDDTIMARDGATDTVRCRAGDDTAYVDLEDAVAPDCEHVFRPPVRIVVPRLLPVGPAGVVPARLSCLAPAGSRCRGRLQIETTVLRPIPHHSPPRTAGNARHKRRRINIRLARRGFSIVRGPRRPVPVRLNRSGRLRLESCRRLKTRIVVVTRDAAGRRAVVRRAVTLALRGARASNARPRPAVRPRALASDVNHLSCG